MITCHNCRNQISDNATFCPYCGASRPLPPQGAPVYPAPKKNNTSNKQVKIVLIVALTAVTVTAAVLVILLMMMNSSKVRAFDFTCSQYTEEMNRLLGDRMLDQNKWVVNDAHAAYKASDFTIDIDLDVDSHLSKKISVSPTDSESAVKMAAASLMVVDKELTQQQALEQLPYYRDPMYNAYVFEADEHKKPKKITSAPEAVGAPTQALISSRAEQPQEESAVPQTEAAPTTAEPTTEAPAVDPQKEAYRAYLEVLEGNSDWFSTSSSGSEKRAAHAIALIDLNGDGVDELICTKYTASNSVPVNLTILTCQNGGIVTMYDESLHAFAGAGGGYHVFIGSDGRLYSADQNYPLSNVTVYDVSGTDVSPTVLIKSTGQGTDSPDVKYYVDDAETTEEDYEALFASYCTSAATCLCYYESGTIKAYGDDITMSYHTACEYLRNNS